MATVAGYKGTVTWNGNVVANVVSLDHGLNMEEIDVSANGVIYKQFLAGQYDSTVSVELHADVADTATDALYADALAGTSRTLLLKFDGTTGNQVTGTAIITSLETSAAQGGAVDLSVTFRYIGAIVFTTS